MYRFTGYVCLLIAGLPALSQQITVLDGISYSNINSNVRQFRVFYPTGTRVSDPLPIVVYIHGGAWAVGGRGDDSITPSVCNGTETIACWLASNDYVVFSIDYTLVATSATASDLTVSARDTVSSDSHRFTASDVGSTLVITTPSGGWNPGGYRVTAVSNREAQLDQSPGAVGANSGAYALLDTDTLWPVQWQDCNCFLRYLAEQAGVSVPGDPQNIILMGHSAGGHLAGVVGLSGDSAFQTNCDHRSTNYTVKGITAFSPPTDLVSIYSENDNAKYAVRDLLGCVPGYGTCNSAAKSASITTYVAEQLPEYVSFSGASDVTVPPFNVEEAEAAFAALRPPVLSPWIEFGPVFSHRLDLFYYSDCEANNEPPPCGSAGLAFQTALPFIQSWTGRVRQRLRPRYDGVY
jgi:acetyl esterase/lipase